MENLIVIRGWFWFSGYDNTTVHKILRNDDERSFATCHFGRSDGPGKWWPSDEAVLTDLADQTELVVCETCIDYEPPTPERIAAVRAEWAAIREASSRSVHASPTAFESNRRRH